jgi:hypothetical protein
MQKKKKKKKKTIIIFYIDIYSFIDNFLNNVNISMQVHMSMAWHVDIILI